MASPNSFTESDGGARRALLIPYGERRVSVAVRVRHGGVEPEGEPDVRIDSFVLA